MFLFLRIYTSTLLTVRTPRASMFYNRIHGLLVLFGVEDVRFQVLVAMSLRSLQYGQESVAITVSSFDVDGSFEDGISTTRVAFYLGNFLLLPC